MPSKKVRALALDIIGRSWVAARAADLAPTIKQLQAAGNTTLRALAAGLNAMGITTARGGNWTRRKCASCRFGSEARRGDEVRAAMSE